MGCGAEQLNQADSACTGLTHSTRRSKHTESLFIVRVAYPLAVVVAISPGNARVAAPGALAQVVDSLGKQGPGEQREKDGDGAPKLLVLIRRVGESEDDDQLRAPRDSASQST